MKKNTGKHTRKSERYRPPQLLGLENEWPRTLKVPSIYLSEEVPKEKEQRFDLPASQLLVMSYLVISLNPTPPRVSGEGS